MTLKSDAKSEEPTCCLENDMRVSAYFQRSTRKYQNRKSRKGRTLKFTDELCVMTMKLTCNFKTDMRNLTNFDSSTRKFKKLLFNLLFNYPRKLSS